LLDLFLVDMGGALIELFNLLVGYFVAGQGEAPLIIPFKGAQ